MTPELLRRQRATEATFAKYREVPFDWKRERTCLHLLRFHLRKMGHKPEPLPRIKSAVAAKRALDARGWKNVGDLLDTMLPRIAPAQMWLGDVAMLESGDGFGAIVVSLGSKVLGWHEDYAGMTALEPLHIGGAWRV
jgi:hypothetical protein